MVVEHCYRPVKRKCYDSLQYENNDGGGGTFCKVMFETDCRTIYEHKSGREEKRSPKSLPQTICKRLPKTLCGGSNCDFIQVKRSCLYKS